MCEQCENRQTTANVTENWNIPVKPEVNIEYHWFLDGKEVNPEDIKFVRIGCYIYTL